MRWTIDQLCLFSQLVIGLIQESYLKTSKKRSMDIAEGVYNRSQNIDKHLPARRSLLLAGSTTDIRSVVDLGSRRCIDIFGCARLCACAWREEAVAGRPRAGVRERTYKNCVEQKHRVWKTYAAIEIASTTQLLGNLK